jgi:hypothetical protein
LKVQRLDLKTVVKMDEPVDTWWVVLKAGMKEPDLVDQLGMQRVRGLVAQ